MVHGVALGMPPYLDLRVAAAAVSLGAGLPSFVTTFPPAAASAVTAAVGQLTTHVALLTTSAFVFSVEWQRRPQCRVRVSPVVQDASMRRHKLWRGQRRKSPSIIAPDGAIIPRKERIESGRSSSSRGSRSRGQKRLRFRGKTFGINGGGSGDTRR